MKLLNTAYFGGLCEPSKDLDAVCMMHANRCFTMDHKLDDLKLMLRENIYGILKSYCENEIVSHLKDKHQVVGPPQYPDTLES